MRSSAANTARPEKVAVAIVGPQKHMVIARAEYHLCRTYGMTTTWNYTADHLIELQPQQE